MFGLFQARRRSGTPFPTAGLLAWFDAAKGVTLSGGNASAWADQSSNHNDVAAIGGTDLPIFNATALNGLPGLLFDTTNGNAQLGTTAAVFANNAPYYAVAVLVPTLPVNGPQGGGFIDGGPVLYPNTPVNSFYPCFGNYAAQTWITGGNQATAPTSIVPGSPNLVEWGSSGYPGTFTAYQDGSSLAPFTGGDATFSDSGSGLYVGSDGGLTGNASFSGYICEILVFDHVLTGTDLAQVRTYLNNKYAL